VAIIVVILGAMVGRAAWKRPNAGARLAALLGLIGALWLVFAVSDASAAGSLVVDMGRGIGALASGLGYVITHA
jgi:hypothetical protein